MRIAVTIFLTDETITPTRLARELEQRGFAGLYLPEHTHIPVERTTPYPAGGDLPREYGRTLDPFVALGQAAAVTRALGLGTGITLVAQHDPIDLAKQIATLDHLSGGRFTLGLGYGWNVEEAADHGVAWRERRESVRDRMGLMRALWSDEPTPYDGPYARVRASHAHPKPAQKPRGPVVGPRTLIGGAAGPKLFSHICEYADGWLPIGGRGLSQTVPALRTAWAEAGREPSALQVVPYAVLPSAGKLAHYADLGIEEVVLQLPPAGETEVLRLLDEYSAHVTGASDTV
ncbi:LLM class F420-dependent oxidoreductase [Streptomyces phaeofaciens JCM 4814]|uniref:LLM class F420-dependent oxidoreductase n=1 Tax=Streptomyces phaeofaciens TaxID=68254 RepID=A0A918HIJ1_9ACTN|nr:LLM class F420-dependent oxidoreductase [Streptomyces phaeofaciens]GGT63625.1 LLM class F420-dependent oxidoreductase [Streptomyces phaeofaciens]